MEKIDHQYDKGWKRYGYDMLKFEGSAAHGAVTEIFASLAFNRGVGKPFVNYAIIPPDNPGQGVGLHVHRNTETGQDSEVWYIIIEGKAEMAFTNGDIVECGPGDLVTTYPGTGHSFRAVGGPVKAIIVAPEMFTYDTEKTRFDPFPEEFDPAIKVLEYEKDSMSINSAVCSVCGEEWHKPPDDPAAETLLIWAREHRHKEGE